MDVPLCASMELLINLDGKEKERVNERERENLALKTDIQKDQGSGKMSVKNKMGKNPGNKHSFTKSMTYLAYL